MQISFETGIQEFTINDAITIRFNPTDMIFIEKIFNLFNELDRTQEKYREAVEAAKDDKELFTITRQMDGEMREAIDTAFGEKICDALFDNLSVFAVSNGLPLWTNLLLVIIDIMDDNMVAEKKKTNPRLQQYIQKYSKYKK